MNVDSPDRSPSPAPRRKLRPSLRQATLILPKTGQRVKKAITLRLHDEEGDYERDGAPLLRTQGASEERRKPKKGVRDLLEGVLASKLGVDILKCSLAYILASLATFVNPIGNLIGHQDSKHMVATVVVYFHPARTAGSMLEAIMLALIAFVYAALMSFASMAVSVAFARNDLLALGHVIILIVFCGGGLGLIAWFKQRLSNPLVNVASSLASLALITILTREGSVQIGKFSYEKVWQVLKMILMGILVSILVAFAVKPRSARKELREDLTKVTDILEEVLTVVTHGFLEGSADQVKPELLARWATQYRTTYAKMIRDLHDAKFEHYMLGTEDEARLEANLVKCVEKLVQSSIGLRSAALTQFDLLKEVRTQKQTMASRRSSYFSIDMQASEDQTNILSVISEEPEDVSDSMGNRTISNGVATSTATAAISEPAEIFSLFIEELGPSMKSLAYTMQEILRDLPFGPGPDYYVAVDKNFRSSLMQAKELYIDARHRSLELLYSHRVLETGTSPEIAADYEEVAASCGYFSSSLQNFAEDTVSYLEILEDLRVDLENSSRKRSWNWLRFWKRRTIELAPSPFHDPDPAHPDLERRTSVIIPHLRRRKPLPSEVQGGLAGAHTAISVRIWRALSFLRREDIRHAMKVGLGAVLYAMFSFIPATRPIYSHWRGEWGLLSFMLVCSMHVGASNTTGLSRFLGTCMGAILAIIAWIIADDSPWVLGLFGWLVSIPCFYIILGLGKGPMGRFILLTYNLSALYAYSLSVQDNDDDDDEGGINPEIWAIVGHRVVAVLSGCLWGLVITRMVWPISARTKLKNGIAVLWLRMGLVWKRGPLTVFEDKPERSYFEVREALKLRRFFDQLQGLQDAAMHEIELRGPFAAALWKDILDATNRVLGSFHAMDVVISKDMKMSQGEAELLKYTKEERKQLSGRLSHLMSVLASSMKLEYPIYDSLPKIEHTRDRFLARIFEFRHDESVNHLANDADYELLYTYALVTYQIAGEIEKLYRYIEVLYGQLDEEGLELR